MKNLFFPLVLICLTTNVFSQGKNRNNNNGNGNNARVQGVFKTDIPKYTFDVILGRPTKTTITISLFSLEDLDVTISYGLNSNKLDQKSKTFNVDKQKTSFMELSSLTPFSKYYYQINYKTKTDKEYQATAINSFQTDRNVGDNFTFNIQADSHLDENTSTEMYTKTLNNMLEDKPDFLVDLGDTWMTDKYRTDYKDSYKQYIAQRYYFGLLGKSSSIFLTLGNHDGESGQQLKKGNADNMTNWATQVRREFYPNPYPNDFYTGNVIKEDGKSYIENYYSWQWGDALFIVLDPFRFTDNNKTPWLRTLGNDQYQWLKKVLESSTAKYKFVFIHNLVGGVDLNGIARGGAEASKFYEWGGLDANGLNAFKQNRPNWELPIHDLLLKHHVNAVFHGHDHFFAKQERDGLVYQLVPQPGPMRYGNINSATEYGYKSGKILNAPGYLRVNVTKENVLVEFVQSSTDSQHQNKQVLYKYTLQN